MQPPKGYQALRKGRISQAGNWYFITKATQERLPQGTAAQEQMERGRLVQPQVPEIIIGSLEWFQNQQLITLMAYCLMPDHLHLLFQLGETAELSNVLDRFGAFTGLQVFRQTGRGKLWAVSYYDHALRNEPEIGLITQYIENNPVEAGLVANASDWHWSSIHWQSL